MTTPQPQPANQRPRPRLARRLILVGLLLALVAVGVKGWRIQQTGMAVYRDVTALREFAHAPGNLSDLEAVASGLTSLRGDLDAFTREAGPLLWLTPKLGWVPVHGGDLSNAPRLLELAGRLVDASLSALEAGQPILDAVNAPQASPDPAELTALLVEARPGLQTAREQFDLALNTRRQIKTDVLSPRLQDLVVGTLDPLLELMDDGLSLSLTMPAILGADGRGPKTYLLLVQNEDELRATGGFITTVGRLMVQNGRIISLDFEGVDNEDDWTKPFPAAPWQLQEYMNTPILILRDSNWFADFPTSARWAEYLYTYNHPGQPDGVIAFDQQFLVLLLRVLGPLEVDGAPYPITSANVIEYMRSAKEPPKDQPLPANWYRKNFIGDLADALLKKILGGGGNDWRGLAAVLVQSLQERHLNLQFDDPAVESLLAENGWDGAVRPGDGDFLMVTDSNIGFNKTNARVEISLSYDVDLTDLSAPTGALNVTHRNNSRKDVDCVQFDQRVYEDYFYAMDRCYWSYFRVYKQAGADLTDASPHEVPAKWNLLNRSIPARVDLLDEDIEGVRGFGTLLVVPAGEALSTGFEFALPAAVVADEGSDRYRYRLKVQKQPGRLADALIVRIHLPGGAQVESVDQAALIQGANLLVETDLRTDVYLEVVFYVP